MKFIKTIIFLILVAIIGVTGVYVNRGYTMYKTALNTISIEDKIKEIEEIKNYTYFNELPKTYVDAVVAVEDRRFYAHNGIDLISIGRAIIKDISSRKLVEGGSTITQQLAKNIYFTQEKKLERKIAESFMAFEIEKACDKNKIFELYVNTSYFGDGYYCVKDASMGYFNKLPIDMTDYESTLLAGIPNAPSVYAPTKNFELASERQKQVLDKMIDYGYMNEEEAIEVTQSDEKNRFIKY